jgi:prepilin-type N-terminal cleavage/methylation domain-containing protein
MNCVGLGVMRMLDEDCSELRVRRGFTIVELLVVIAIIGVLIGLLLPALQAARESARRVICVNKLKQIGVALNNYNQAHGHFPPGSTSEDTQIGGPYYTTWTIDVLPYLEQQSLFDKWDQKTGLYSNQNKELRESFVDAYLCPDDIDTDKLGVPDTGPGGDGWTLWAPGSYRAMSGHSSGANGNLYWDNPKFAIGSQEKDIPDWTRGPIHTIARNPGRGDRRFGPVESKFITDGISRTLMVGESQTTTVTIRRTFWAYAYTSYNQSSGFTERCTILPDYARCVGQISGGTGSHTCKRGWGSLHRNNILQFAYCDGSVHSISPEIDMTVFVAGSTISGGEVLNLPGD